MKLSKLIKSSIAMLTIAIGLNASNFSEGTDYIKLDNPIPNADNTVIKVFSYDCPFCYRYDKTVTPAMVKTLPSNVEYKIFHLKNKGKYGTQASQLYAAALEKDRANGIKDLFDDKSTFKKAKMAHYAAYHDKKERWNGGEADFLKTAFDASGLTKAEYDAALNNENVKKDLAAWEQSLEIARYQGVPAFVVNGKYLVQTKSIKSVQGFSDLVKELLAK